MSRPRLGPATAATIITNDLHGSTALYTEHLHQVVHSEGRMDEKEASALGWRALAGASECWLANALGEPWLRFVESADCQRSQPFTCYGWLSLEIAVEDVDALAQELKHSPFRIIGPPRNLAMSDAIRAMQVAGPNGEVLYLTEVKRPLPPFELPVARCKVDRLFIPVMMCPDRGASLSHYSTLSGNEGLEFETQITVINAALGLPASHQHPVATLQLEGNTLIEMDQVADLEPAPFNGEHPPTGIALIHFEHADAATGTHIGAAGERYVVQCS